MFKLGLFIIKLISYVPFFILYGISSILALLFCLIPSIKKVPYRNFYRVYPDSTQWHLFKMTYRYFCAFIDYFFEMAKMTSFSEKKMRRHCVFKNIELLERLSENHQFILCFSGHVVNYEMFTSLPLHTKDIGMCHLYLSAPPSKGLDWMLKERGKYGAVNIPSGNPVRTILKLKKEMDEGTSPYKCYIFGSLSDMDPKRDDKHAVPFLDHMLEVKVGAEKLARKLNMAFCYAYIRRPKRGYYEVEFVEITPKTNVEEDECAYTDEFVHLFEQNIKEKPELWMQWGSCRF